MEDITVQVHNSPCSHLLSALATYTTKVLKPNISQNTNTLSQLDFDSRNVKYVIKWDYDLLDAVITIPKNCLIEFDGGSIRNGTLIGDNTIIVTCQKDEDILKNVNLEGTFKFNGRSADLKLSYQDFDVENNEKVDTQYKTVVITDEDGKAISFDVLVPVRRHLNEYTITINAMEGSVNDPEYTAAGDIYSISKLEDTYITLPTPTRNGYAFKGWNTDAQGAGTTYEPGTLKVTQNLTLYAIWVQIHTVRIYKNDGTNDIVQTYNVEHGNTIILPASLIREHYDFGGWNTQQNGSGTNYNASSALPITGNIDLYAKWTDVYYTITFNIDGGSGSAPNSVSGVFGSLISLPTYSGTKQGYHLTNGWFDGNNSVGSFGGSYTITGNKTLKIKWTAVQHQYLLSTSIPSAAPTWSESNGTQTTLGALTGWSSWKNQTYQYISFPKKSSEDINDYLEHLDAYESSITYLYIKQTGTLNNVITFRFNIMETMVPLGDSNQNNKVKIK